jgi:rubrerythrin
MDIDSFSVGTPAEVLRFAMLMEKHAESFYRAISSKIKDHEMQRLFSDFADEEKRHHGIYESMLFSFSKTALHPIELENITRILLYFKSRFYSPELLKEKFKHLDDLGSVFDMAISAELDAMLFYGEMKTISLSEHHQLLDDVISEERRHFRHLLKLKQAKNL